MSAIQQSEGTTFVPILPNFWTETIKSKEIIITIETDKLIDFCSKLGYYNYVDYTGTPILVRVTRNCILQESRIEEVKQSFKTYLRKVVKRQDVWEEFAKRNYITQNVIHLIEKLPEINFNVSQENIAHFFYKNGVVIISNTKYKLIPYEEFKGAVWKPQIIKRDFIARPDSRECTFYKFLFNVCAQDMRRFNSLISILGYLLHPYKDPSVSKAVILIDEKVDFSMDAHGGTGKTLIAKAISQIIQTVTKDGKKYNPYENFLYDDIRPYHRLLYFDDVKRNFSLEEFFSLITGSLRVTRKYKDAITLPPELAPKLLISSNHMVQGTGGDSDERRRIEFEIAPYYSMNFTPRDEFNHNFFEEWDIAEWQRFDTFMLLAVKHFINNGIIMPPQINIKENKLKMITDPDFIIFMDQSIILDTPCDKAHLLDQYQEICPAQRLLSAITFKRWIDKWVDARGYVAYHIKSNGKTIVTISEKNNTV